MIIIDTNNNIVVNAYNNYVIKIERRSRVNDYDAYVFVFEFSGSTSSIEVGSYSSYVNADFALRELIEALKNGGDYFYILTNTAVKRKLEAIENCIKLHDEGKVIRRKDYEV